MHTTFAFCWLSFSLQPQCPLHSLHARLSCKQGRLLLVLGLHFLQKSCKSFNVYRIHVSGDKQEVNPETTIAVRRMTFLPKKKLACAGNVIYFNTNLRARYFSAL